MIGWRAGESCGAGFRIGMIDMAPGPSPALSGQKLHLQSFLDQGKQAFDNGHGTAIASLLIGHGLAGHTEAAGLLPAADLYAAAVFARDGDRSEASAFAIAGALDWMAANQVRVVNISLSGDANSLLEIAAQRAAAKGAVLVAAAGNGGPGAPPAYPAALPGVIAVTAVDQEGHVYSKANQGSYIAFSAPWRANWAPAPDALGEYLTGNLRRGPLHRCGCGTRAHERCPRRFGRRSAAGWQAGRWISANPARIRSTAMGWFARPPPAGPRPPLSSRRRGGNLSLRRTSSVPGRDSPTARRSDPSHSPRSSCLRRRGKSLNIGMSAPPSSWIMSCASR